ncbi:lysophospholipid acyltransferase 7-like isoform X2 [Watersipora subatra]
MHALSFLWCFSYLAFFRTCHWFGLEEPSAPSNAVQLLLTLKLVGVAGEVVETENLKAAIDSTECTDINTRLKLKYKGIDYSCYRLVTYSFCYIGAFTGPYFTCRTFQDMVHNNDATKLPLWSDLKRRLQPLPVCGALFFFLTWLVSIETAREERFYEETSVFYRYGYLFLLFLRFRVRFYSAWILAECMAVAAGLGGYPSRAENRPGAGPTNLKVLDEAEDGGHDFETVRNILPVEIELSSSVSASIKHWNILVQWWLVVNVYKNIPTRNKLLRSIILMIISAFWHGVHPGWYATFLSAPFLLLAEDSMNRGLKHKLKSRRLCAIYDTISCFLGMRFFEYFVVGAFFLQYNEIYHFWKSLYFYGHILLIAIIFIGQILILSTGKVERPHKS